MEEKSDSLVSVPTQAAAPAVAAKKTTANAPGYMGFVAGVFSGIAKLAVGHPFDTVKVRLQTAPKSQFSGPMDCVRQTIKNEGIRAFYKGATPPLVGWMVMDSVMLGSLHNYRRLLKNKVWPDEPSLPFIGKITAGALAGWTVSFVAAPVEHVKARLQVQYDAKTKLYTGPINAAATLIRKEGLFHGLYRGLLSTMIFRTNFIFWWGSYDIFQTQLRKHVPSMPETMINFWAGGLGATVFWITAYPSDVIKQTIMTRSLDLPQISWWATAKQIYARAGWAGFFRGFGPSILRSFPANGAALAAFEAAMSILHNDK